MLYTRVFCKPWMKPIGLRRAGGGGRKQAVLGGICCSRSHPSFASCCYWLLIMGKWMPFIGIKRKTRTLGDFRVKYYFVKPQQCPSHVIWTKSLCSFPRSPKVKHSVYCLDHLDLCISDNTANLKHVKFMNRFSLQKSQWLNFWLCICMLLSLTFWAFRVKLCLGFEFLFERRLGRFFFFLF